MTRFILLAALALMLTACEAASDVAKFTWHSCQQGLCR